MQEINAQQILVPKKVYIGDAAELRCTFNSPDATLKALTEKGVAHLSFPEPANTEENSTFSDYVIKNVTLSPAGVDFYQLSITFVPWKTGDIVFPPLTIEGSELVLIFNPFNIVSLITADDKTATALRDTTAPLLLPGTAYKLYGALAAVVLLLILTIRIIIKRKTLLFYINERRLVRKYKKNKKMTIKQLKQISLKAEAKNSENSFAQTEEDGIFAEQIQKTLRNYLEVRFDYPFTKTVSSEIMAGFYKATNGLLSEAKEEAFGEIASSFIRTDYIRYKTDANFEQNELQTLIKKIIQNIETLELNEKPEEEKNA